MDDELFRLYVDEAISSIPKEFLERIENVSIVISDLPSDQQLKKAGLVGSDRILLGLYEGIPKTKRRGYGIGLTLPDKITIFKNSILSMAKNEDHLYNIVRNVIIHEIAHHFGMDENSVRDAESQRRNLK